MGKDRLNVRPPDGDLFAHKQRDWWEKLELSATERLRVDQDVATLDHIGPQITAVDAELRRLSTSELWADQVPYLVQLPGIALLSAMTILARDVQPCGPADEVADTLQTEVAGQRNEVLLGASRISDDHPGHRP